MSFYVIYTQLFHWSENAIIFRQFWSLAVLEVVILTVQLVMKISSRWQHFLFSVYERAQCVNYVVKSLLWRHNECHGISNHQPHECLLNRLFGRRSKKTSKLRVTGLCLGNSPETVENVSIWWRHHVIWAYSTSHGGLCVTHIFFQVDTQEQTSENLTKLIFDSFRSSKCNWKYRLHGDGNSV